MNKIELQEKKIEVLTSLDFEKIVKVYRLLNWEWFFPDGGSRIPSINDLQETVISLIDDAVKYSKENNENIVIIDTGGFEVIYNKTSNSIAVRFIVEEAEL